MQEESPDVGTGMVPVTEEPTAVVPANAGDIGALMELAITKNLPVETFERLVALQERITDRNARMSYVGALSSFRAECPQPKRNLENPQFEVTRGGTKRKATYSSLGEIERTARPVAAQHGLTWTWDTRVEESLMHVTCRVQHVEGHGESATVAMPYASNAGSSPQQKYGSTQMYGMRYSLIAALGITSADDDVDGSAGIDAQVITEDQAADLAALIHETGSDLKKFLEFMGVDSLDEVAVGKLPRAIKMLEGKRGSE